MTQRREFASRHLRRAYAEGFEGGREEGLAQGLAESLARAVLRVLVVRGVSAEVEERVRGCRDIATTRGWLEQAVTVSSADELTP